MLITLIVLVTKVLNEFGPQTRLLQEPTEPVCKQENRITIKQEPGCSSSSVPCSSTGMSCPTGLEERLHNLEDHLRLKTGTATETIFIDKIDSRTLCKNCKS